MTNAQKKHEKSTKPTVEVDHFVLPGRLREAFFVVVVPLEKKRPLLQAVCNCFFQHLFFSGRVRGEGGGGGGGKES